ncbi:hypothetical protein [Hirschia litorea]|uniref:Uncharacterized protein n=1 Tax=Hirschia litorea TaxID=1199156 RepID=A0ABW2IKR3_9PROT
MINFISRAPFVVLGAIGLVTLSSSFIDLHQSIVDWVTIYQTISHALWDFLLGWVPKFTGWELTKWAKDYMTAGVIVSSAAYRTFSKFGKDMLILMCVLAFVCWPMFIYVLVWEFWFKRDTDGYNPFLREIPDLVMNVSEEDMSYDFYYTHYKGQVKSLGLLFFETFIYAALTIAVSYGLMFSSTH